MSYREEEAVPWIRVSAQTRQEWSAYVTGPARFLAVKHMDPPEAGVSVRYRVRAAVGVCM